ncbi:uncharacterized protein LOC122299733 [Carya illinoinensis]|uniref:uncharacterized protein LOC122299733 n=1 Tax=Carya illinoinensis TaxID=32201 RepID=UPI001C719F54|nr:uncharacterized protein LOC122299733 [Carya illinoinensis]
MSAPSFSPKPHAGNFLFPKSGLTSLSLSLSVSPSLGAPFATTQSGSTIGEYAFADVGNLEHCAKYLNRTLVTYGFPASLDLFANDPVSVARTCNCLYSLLQQRQRDVEFRDSASEQRQRMSLTCPFTWLEIK